MTHSRQHSQAPAEHCYVVLGRGPIASLTVPVLAKQRAKKTGVSIFGDAGAPDKRVLNAARQGLKQAPSIIQAKSPAPEPQPEWVKKHAAKEAAEKAEKEAKEAALKAEEDARAKEEAARLEEEKALAAAPKKSRFSMTPAKKGSSASLALDTLSPKPVSRKATKASIQGLEGSVDAPMMCIDC